MYDILDGVRVIELSLFAFGPSACAVLGDWGADVIKVGHPSFQDPMRGIPVGGLPRRDDDLSFTWEQLNRNKRSIALDVSHETGRAVLDDLLRDADVFVTNLLPESRARLRVDVDDVRAVNPRIIYGRATGQGANGPDRDRGAFDHTAFWCRSGIGHAASMTVDEFVPLVGPAFGDLASGFVLASGIVAALLRRERTGKATVVDASLLSTAMWMFSPAVVASGIYDDETLPRQRHRDLLHPLVAAYETADGRHVYLAGVRTDKNWENLCACLERPDLVHDERFDDAAPELRPAPEHGADTEAVLLELGRTWDDIGELKAAGVIP